MTQVAIRLSESGAGDYWEDVDSYVRNHLTEIQLPDEAKLRQVTSSVNGTYAENYAAGDRDYTNVVHRIIGTVTDDSSHLTRVPQVSAVSTICGPGNVTSAICYAGEAIVRCADGEARVQLLLNRASPWLGNYVILDTIRPGDRVTITFPMVTTTERYTLKWKLSEMWQESTDPGREWINANPTTYTMTFKGNTLVEVTPRDSGTGLPLYERKPMHEATAAPMKTVTRFVADTTP
jgi:hypothetical protein